MNKSDRMTPEGTGSAGSIPQNARHIKCSSFSCCIHPHQNPKEFL